MIWAVLDTNILVSGMGWGGPPSRVVDLAIEGRFLLISSQPLLAELAEVLARPHLSDYFPDPLGTVLLVEAAAVMVEPTTQLDVVEDDPDDNRVLEAAQEGHADFIVSGDQHLLGLGIFDGMQILTARQFLEVLGAEEGNGGIEIVPE